MSSGTSATAARRILSASASSSSWPTGGSPATTAKFARAWATTQISVTAALSRRAAVIAARSASRLLSEPSMPTSRRWR
jgi:hypothetical protein